MSGRKYRAKDGVRLGFGNPKRTPFAQYVDGEWRVWLDYNPAMDAGTVIVLKGNGEAEGCVVEKDGSVRRRWGVIKLISPEIEEKCLASKVQTL